LTAVVVGGGIGGIAAAVALTRAGVDVRVYEQAPGLTEVGAGVVLAPNSLRLLERLGLGAEVTAHGAALSDTRLFHADGRPAEHDPDQFSRPGERVGMHRADLLAILAGRLPPGAVRTGTRCTGFIQDPSRAVALFDGGQRAEADVVIAADGIHSALQRYVVEPADPLFSGVVAYRGVVPAERVPSWPPGTMRLWMGEGKHFLAFPVRSGRLLNYVGFVPSDERMRESWSAPGDPAALAAEFAGWDPVIATIIAAIGPTGFRWGLYDRAPLSCWSRGRLTLLGDAAHPMLPHMGQGVNQAIEDAIAVATMLGAVQPSGVARALQAYEALRRERTARIQQGSRRSGARYDASGGDRSAGDRGSGVPGASDYGARDHGSGDRGSGDRGSGDRGSGDRGSGVRLQNRRWIYDYDVQAEAVSVAAALRAGS
jgi:salicylate hydroxylase